MEQFKDVHLANLELLSNTTTIDSALNHISSKQSQQKGFALDSANKDDNDRPEINSILDFSKVSPTKNNNSIQSAN